MLRAASGVALVLSFTGAARAQDAQLPPRVHVSAEGEGCPSGEQLQGALEPLLGPGRVTLDAGTEETPHASVADRGARYVIEAEGLLREIDDATRDCEERARVAAVLIALNVGETEERKPPPEPPSPPPPPPPEPPPAIEEPPLAIEEALAIGMQLLGSAELATEIDAGAFGGAASLFIGDEGLGAVLDVGLLSPVMMALEPRGGMRARAELMRVPIALSARYVVRAGSFGWGPSLGLAVDVLRVQGSDVERAQTAVRASFGALLAAELHAQLAPQLDAMLRVYLRAFPSTYRLAVAPEGTLAETPRLWVGAGLGLAWRFR